MSETKIVAPAKIIAMWSGPRNLSTAMMRSFGSRPDCRAMDEPFYAAYLAATGLDHPMRDEVIAAGETDPAKVIGQCLAPPEPAFGLVYQKHMTHHMIEGFDLGWIGKVTNVFLIRSPAKVLASYAKKRGEVTPDDIGVTRQRELFERAMRATGEAPPVVDSADILRAPEPMLRALCERLSIPFMPEMLKWPAGRRPEDGVWGDHWYEAVWKSTGFGPPRTDGAGDEPELPDHLREIADEVAPDYAYMSQHRLRADAADG